MQAPLTRRPAISAAILLLLMISLADAYTLDMAGLQGHVAHYNANIDKAPALLKSVLGSEKVNLVITRDNGSVFRAGVEVQRGRIDQLIPEGYSDPTITVTTDESAIDQVVGAKDKITTFTDLIEQGKINIQTNSWLSDIKIKGLLSSSSVLQFGFDLFFG